MILTAVIGRGAAASRHIAAIRSSSSSTFRQISSREFDEIQSSGSNRNSWSSLGHFSLAIIASPASRHVDQALAFLRSGVSVLVEKPLSLTSHDCFQLAAMSQQTGLKVQVGYVLRFSESFWYFRDQLRNFGLQNVYLVDVLAESYFPLWRPNVHYADTVSAQAMLGGGVLRELSHELDYLVNLFGRIQLESAQLSRSLNLKTDVETRAEIVALAGQDIQVRVKLDMCSSNEARYCRVKFKSGHELVWDIVGQTVETRLNNRQLEKRIFLDYREAWFLRQFQTALGSSSWWNEVPSLDEGLEVLRLIDEIREVAPIDSRQ